MFKKKLHKNNFVKNFILKLGVFYESRIWKKLSLIIGGFFLSTTLVAGPVDLIYYVSDGSDSLFVINRTTGVIDSIGPCGVSNIEAIAMWPAPGNNTLYAANADRLGTLNLTTGAYTALPNDFDGGGTADGALGPQSLNDVDGLAFDAWTGILWGSERNGTTGVYDLVFHIDPATGLYIPDAFGPGVDYIVVDGTGVNFDIDDLAINPADGLVYAVSNVGGSTDELITINKATGEVTVIADLTFTDVEGLDFHNDAGFYGVTGSGAVAIYSIDESTAVMTELHNPLTGSDLESCAALVADLNTINGTVWNDADYNQSIGGTELFLAGVTLDLYYDDNGDGLINSGDFMLQSTTTDALGNYQFYFGTTANLLILIDDSSLPAGFAMTTTAAYAVSFTDGVNFGEVSNNNNFGATDGADCDADGIPDFFEGTIDSDLDSVLDECDLDSDNDGIPDSVEGIADNDGDGTLNYLDLDSDNDGIPDAIEANDGVAPVGYVITTGRIAGAVGLNGMVDAIETGLESGVSILPNNNTDGDSNLDIYDLDSDNDGILDAVEAGGEDNNRDGEIDGFTDANDDGYHDPLNTTALAIPNTDGLTGANYIDIDSDNDGIDDTREGYTTVAYQEPNFIVDNDGDGIIDFWDISYGGASILPYNHDGDGLPDYIDTDTDEDSILDEIEGYDLDKDGVVDVSQASADTDGDGLDNNYDPSPSVFGSYTTMALQDSDNDGSQDWRDIDDDNDGILTPLEPTDDDVNTVVDYLEAAASCVASGPVFSGNGLTVISNVGFNNPNNALGAPDAADATTSIDAELVIELDHLVRYTEDVLLTMSGDAPMSVAFSSDNIVWTSPISGVATGTVGFTIANWGGAKYVRIKRLSGGSDDLNLDALAYSFQSCFADTDGDTRTDDVDIDDDNDGILDVKEVCGALATDFSCIGGDPLSDNDNDGLPNYKDSDFCTLNAHGICESLDFDNDGQADFLDLDSDNDGLTDAFEAGGADADGDGIIDGFVDSNMDGITDVFNPCPSCDSIPMPDTDGDNLADFLDLDADNDGVPDIIEAGGLDVNGDGFVDNTVDLDNDGLADVYDSDDDGTPGIEDSSDPLLVTGADTDNDGLPNSYPNGDADGDTVRNHLDIDADNDGIMDVTETNATDSNNDGKVDDGAGSFVDTDGDGFMDTVDGDVGNDASFESSNPLIISNADSGTDTDTRLEYTGNGISDSDSDDVPDFLDVDSDNDGLFDNYEGQATMSYIPPGTVDSDGDGLLNAYDLNSAAIQNGITPYNHDTATGDTLPDYLDLDSDADNIPDKQEAWDNLADGDSREDNVPSCTNVDADGDGLIDCFDSNDADANIYTWAGNPADDTDGANGSAAGTVFVDNLDVILPDNIGADPLEPDYRDGINACASGQIYYGITEASAGTTTEYEYSEGTNMHLDGAATSIIRATTYCEPDGDGWFYFYNPLEPDNFLFAIKNNAASPNTVAISDLIDYIEIKIAPDPTTRHVPGGTQATLVMERDWSVIYKGTPTPGSSFDVKFYFQQAEMAALDAAATHVVNNATSPVRGDLIWFEKAGGVEDSDILSTGIVGMIDVTANDPLGIDEGFPGIPDGTSSATGNAKNYVEFVGLTSLSGGGTAAIEVSYAALPVELIAFEGEVVNCENQISWVTASEKDFSHFELQRSSDDRDFKTIKKIEAQGGIITKAYQYIDEQVEQTSYYRLVMKDLDGSLEYSNVIALTMDCELDEDEFVVFPNPVAAEEGVLNLGFSTEVGGEKNFVITDVLSRTLLVVPLEVVEGKNRLQIDVSDLPAGTYFLNLIGKSNKVISKKFMIME